MRSTAPQSKIFTPENWRSIASVQCKGEGDTLALHRITDNKYCTNIKTELSAVQSEGGGELL